MRLWTGKVYVNNEKRSKLPKTKEKEISEEIVNSVNNDEYIRFSAIKNRMAAKLVLASLKEEKEDESNE